MNILKVSAKCSDLCLMQFHGLEHDGYVPDWFPNRTVKHYGDYIELQIDMNTGRILNWKKPTIGDLLETFGQRNRRRWKRGRELN